MYDSVSTANRAEYLAILQWLANYWSGCYEGQCHHVFYGLLDQDGR